MPTKMKKNNSSVLKLRSKLLRILIDRFVTARRGRMSSSQYIRLNKIVKDFLKNRNRYLNASQLLKKLESKIARAGIISALLLFANLSPVNAATPTFVEQTGAANPFNGETISQKSAPVFIDIDGDGDYDVFVGNTDGKIQFFKNTGSSTSPAFDEQTGANNPLSSVDLEYISTIGFADIDNDGDFDAYITQRNTSRDNFFYRNTGSTTSPTFSVQTGTNNPLNGVNVGNFASIHFADIDNDGDYDAFLGEYDKVINYFKNTGSATSPTMTEQTGSNALFPDPVVDAFVTRISLADIDNDEDLDAFIGDWDGTLTYYKNTGSSSGPIFSKLTGVDNPMNGVDVGDGANPAFVDIDGDGDTDLFVGEDDAVINYYKNTNNAPTALDLSASTVAEKTVADVGTLSTTDADSSDTHTYSLVAGTGDTDNASFTISGDTLKTANASVTAGQKNIRIKVTDNLGGKYEKVFNIDVTSTPAVVTDTTAPVFVASYPKTSTIGSNSFIVVTQLNEPGKVYYVILTDGATAPSASEVKNGTGSAGSTAVTSGNFAILTANSDTSATITGLIANTAYDVYVIAEDDESTPNLQSSATLVEVSTNNDNNAPTVPSLTSPENGATVTLPLTLTWKKSSDPDGDAVTYSYLVCEDQDFSGCDATNVTSSSTS
ncbi:VCBS repeat-containing protein, partial [bacterium]|nr:VCBS repeat-containing protein [bacterium]